MNAFTRLEATAIPLRRANVDTDQIIPARFLTTVSRSGLGQGLFAAWRSAERDFPLDQPRFQGAQILLAGPNFGSGSSREHAVWALTDFGFRVVVAPAFADIFRANSLTNGLLPVELPEAAVEELMDRVEGEPATRFTLDLAAQSLQLEDGSRWDFSIDPFRKACLLEGQDDLGYLLDRLHRVEAFEASRAGVCS